VNTDTTEKTGDTGTDQPPPDPVSWVPALRRWWSALDASKGRRPATQQSAERPCPRDAITPAGSGLRTARQGRCHSISHTFFEFP
jgi:hypothetical protein